MDGATKPVLEAWFDVDFQLEQWNQVELFSILHSMVECICGDGTILFATAMIHILVEAL